VHSPRGRARRGRGCGPGATRVSVCAVRRPRPCKRCMCDVWRVACARCVAAAAGRGGRGGSLDTPGGDVCFSVNCMCTLYGPRSQKNILSHTSHMSGVPHTVIPAPSTSTSRSNGLRRGANESQQHRQSSMCRCDIRSTPLILVQAPNFRAHNLAPFVEVLHGETEARVPVSALRTMRRHQYPRSGVITHAAVHALRLTAAQRRSTRKCHNHCAGCMTCPGPPR